MKILISQYGNQYCNDYAHLMFVNFMFAKQAYVEYFAFIVLLKNINICSPS